MLNHLNKQNYTGAESRKVTGGAGPNDRSTALFLQKHSELEKESGAKGWTEGRFGRFASAFLVLLSTNLAIAQDIPKNIPYTTSTETSGGKTEIVMEQKLPPTIAGEAPAGKKAVADSTTRASAVADSASGAKIGSAGSAGSVKAVADSASGARPKISVRDSAAYIFGYEYIAIHSGKSYDIESLDTNGNLQPTILHAEGLRIMGGLELESRDACMNAYQTILYGDFAYVQINPQADLMLTIPRSEIAAIRIRGTDYEIKISGSAWETELSIQKTGSDDPRDVYAVVRCTRSGPAFGTADYLDGENLRALASAGVLKVQPVKEESLEGFPAYNPRWKEIELAVPREK